MSVGNLSPWHSVWDRNATGKRVITEGRLPFRVTTSSGLQNPLTYLVLGRKAEHLDSLAHRGVPYRQRRSTRDVRASAATRIGVIACAPLPVSNHHHAMSWRWREHSGPRE